MFRKSTIFRIIFILLVIFIILFISRNASETVSNTVAVLTAVLGLIAILYQLQRDHSIKRAEFIYSLNDSFNDDKKIVKSYDSLKSHRGTDLKFSPEDVSNMGSYVMFFMIMNYLVNKNLVNIKMIDKIFANKFFILCNNEYVQKHQLSKRHVKINYPIMELYETWYNYRVIKGYDILYKNCNYAKNTEIYTEKNDLIQFNFKSKHTIGYYFRVFFHKSNLTEEQRGLKVVKEEK